LGSSADRDTNGGSRGHAGRAGKTASPLLRGVGKPTNLPGRGRRASPRAGVPRDAPHRRPPLVPGAPAGPGTPARRAQRPPSSPGVGPPAGPSRRGAAARARAFRARSRGAGVPDPQGCPPALVQASRACPSGLPGHRNQRPPSPVGSVKKAFAGDRIPEVGWPLSAVPDGQLLAVRTPGRGAWTGCVCVEGGEEHGPARLPPSRTSTATVRPGKRLYIAVRAPHRLVVPIRPTWPTPDQLAGPCPRKGEWA